MAYRNLSSKPTTILSSVIRSLQIQRRFFLKSPLQPTIHSLALSLSRVLKENRNPRDDLETSLSKFETHISPKLVERVIDQSKNLGFSAHRFFLWAKRIHGFKHSRESYNLLVGALGHCKEFALLWDLLIDVRDSGGFEVDSEIFRIVFLSYGKANLPRDAIRAFNRMTEFRVKPTVEDFHNLLETLCETKNVEHALEFFEKVKTKFELTSKSYMILVVGCGYIGDADNARKLFDEMLHRDFPLNVFIYNVYLKALCNGGFYGEAYKVFQGMPEKNVKPNRVTYTIFIKAYCKSGDIDAVFRVLNIMKKHNIKPELSTYNCFIEKLCKSGKDNDVYVALNEMIENGVMPDQTSFYTVLAFHCNRNEVNQALGLLAKFENFPGANPGTKTYTKVLRLLIRLERYDKLAEIWKEFPKKGIFRNGSMYSAIIFGLCKKKSTIRMACDYFEDMVDKGIMGHPTVVGLLRDYLIRFQFDSRIEIIAQKMKQSSCFSIREMAHVMNRDGPFIGPAQKNKKSKSDDDDDDNDNQSNSSVWRINSWNT